MGALMAVEINSWQDLTEIQKQDKERQIEVCEKFPSIFEMETEKKDDVEKQKISTVGYSERYIISDEDAAVLTNYDISFTVKKFKGTVPYRVNDNDKAQADNLHIHVPNYSLNSYNKVMVIEDACTDELQKHLNDGWRIICACPPLNQRRPDYILGKSEV